MQHDEFLSIVGAVERLAELGQTYSADRIRALIDSGQLPCAVHWLTRYCWLYVDPRGAAHHEANGWPEWTAARPEDLCPNEENPNPPLIFFTDDKGHPNLNDRVGRPRPGGSGGLNLANFRPGLFIPAAAIEALRDRAGCVKDELHTMDLPKPVQRSAAMQATILKALILLEYDPKAVPRSGLGKPGARSEVRQYLTDNAMVVTDSVFRKAWQALRLQGEIIDA